MVNLWFASNKPLLAMLIDVIALLFGRIAIHRVGAVRLEALPPENRDIDNRMSIQIRSVQYLLTVQV